MPGQPMEPDPEGREDVALQERTTTQPPRMYRVLVHNDDYTTMEFVIEVLVRWFDKAEPEAMRVMLQVHHLGAGAAGTYTRDEAETRIAEVTAEARGRGFPLLLTMEPE
ncbi:ATP-dependent Clp protease adaptor ClpS [Longimicrobium sp.]|jgi:ATP-dependent Clp protease adaptor protein ClpS|uniref:ATP-dependent Clp protease adaptor ClpS n=1 Tax=Longimicrobium sp. TaxID=2029185 RepID=UPI002EDA7B4E